MGLVLGLYGVLERGVKTSEAAFRPFESMRDRYEIWPVSRSGTVDMIFVSRKRPGNLEEAGLAEIGVQASRHTSVSEKAVRPTPSRKVHPPELNQHSSSSACANSTTHEKGNAL